MPLNRPVSLIAGSGRYRRSLAPTRFPLALGATLYNSPAFWISRVAPEQLEPLLAGLWAKNPVQRQHARRELVAMGHAAVAPLIQLTGDQRPHVRWEAAKALGDIGDPAAIPALVKTLSDPDADVRWLAALGLSKIGGPALESLLAELIRNPRSGEIAQAVRQVCLVLLRQKPYARAAKLMLNAFHSYEPDLSLPCASYRALHELRSVNAGRTTQSPPS